MLQCVLVGLVGFAFVVLWRMLYPKPYPGIPYVEASAKRITGDVPDLMAAIQSTGEITDAMFTVTTQKLGKPVAQILFPRFRKPLIVLEDPYEVEDIIVRRHREFDKSPMAVNVFKPMFPLGTLSQYTTPDLKSQKRLWADVMQVDFLRTAAAPNIHRATVELLQLWRLKAANDQPPFNVLEDLKNATLDAMWGALIGDYAGVTMFEIQKLQAQLAGEKFHGQAPQGSSIRTASSYISDTIFEKSKTLMPTWALKLETYTPRYRRFRKVVIGEVTRAMKQAIDRYERLEMGMLEADDSDTCMMDLVLRRQILEAKKAGKKPSDPTKDQNMLDEMFIMLVGGHDSTASTLAWFVKFMGLYPSVQKELRTALKVAFPGSRLPSVDQVLDSTIPYLDATCEECLRLAGTSKGNLRQALVDTEILGYKIPKGAELLLNYHINREPLPFHESQRSPSSRSALAKHGNCFTSAAGRDLANFDPRRWLTKDKSGRETFDVYAIPSLSFGGGYRGCFGRKLATMEVRIMIVLCILKFEVIESFGELRDMRACEKLFRHPQMPFASIRAL